MDLKTYTILIFNNEITIQRAPYIDDGWFIKVEGNTFILYEIPLGGGEEIKIDEFKTLIEAIEAINTIT